MVPAGPLPVAIYARISRDQKRDEHGVTNQIATCRSLADSLGWLVAATFVDNDISAYSGAPRPQYRAMLDAVRRGEIRGIVAWHTDRLHRRPAELEEFIALAEAHSIEIKTVTAGDLDLSTSSGRMVARMLGAAARHEVDHARERMQSAKRAMAEKGEWRGGQRPYGYDDGGMALREDEAAMIREATTSVLAGRTLAGIAREMNERGYRTSKGRPWTYQRLKDMLIRPRNAGLVAHGVPGRKPDGRGRIHEFEIVGPARWPAVLDRETWDAVVATLCDPERRRQDGNEPRWLGSGSYTCAVLTSTLGADGEPEVCGGLLRAAPYAHKLADGTKRRIYSYRCTIQNHLTVHAGKTDDHVRQVVADLVRDPRVQAAMTTDNGTVVADREERVRLEARLRSFERDYENGDITGAQLRRFTDNAMARLEAVEARLTANLRRATSTSILRAPDPGAAFLAAPIDIQRAVLQTVLRVEVRPNVRRGLAWTSDRLKITPAVETTRQARSAA